MATGVTSGSEAGGGNALITATASIVAQESDVSAKGSQRLQVRGEMAQEWSFIGKAHAGDSGAVLPDFENDFDYIVDMALRVNAARDREAH